MERIFVNRLRYAIMCPNKAANFVGNEKKGVIKLHIGVTMIVTSEMKLGGDAGSGHFVSVSLYGGWGSVIIHNK